MGCAIYRIVADIVCSTLMYIEAEAKMDSYEAQDGSARTSLNLLQRKSPTQEDEADVSNQNYRQLRGPLKTAR